MTPRWIKIDHRTVTLYRLSYDDECFYAREYKVGGGYAASEANQLILNLKKPMDRKDLPGWKYKAKAIAQFARELAEILPHGAVVACIPPSKSVDDPEYDDRLSQTLAALQGIRPDVTKAILFETKQSHDPSHLGGTRDPDSILLNMRWCGNSPLSDVLFVVDDVITSGGHFAACKRMIIEHWPDCRVIGFFWALARDDF